MTSLYKTSIIVEVLGIGMIGVAAGIELALHADYAFIAMTIGSLCIATGGMLWVKILRRKA